METTPVAKYLIHEGCSALFVGLVLFGCAGQVRWWPGWVQLAMTVSLSAAIGVIGVRTRPNLLVERVGSRRGDERWDVAIYAAIRMGLLACLVVAALDRRLEWTGAFDFRIQVVGVVVHLLGNALFVWAVASNRFFSDMVRIQSHDGHAVATGGPYRWVRHPGYLGSIAYTLAVPVLLASWWAFFPAALCVVVFVLRTALEDRTLQEKLAGYPAFAERVRYRLLPAIW